MEHPGKVRVWQSPGLTAAGGLRPPGRTRADRLLLPRTLKADFKVLVCSYIALSLTVRLRRHVADLLCHCLHHQVGPAVLRGSPPSPPAGPVRLSDAALSRPAGSLGTRVPLRSAPRGRSAVKERGREQGGHRGGGRGPQRTWGHARASG